jgi:hypothetical protein
MGIEQNDREWLFLLKGSYQRKTDGVVTPKACQQ